METSLGKSRIVNEIGQTELLLPALANEALAANDRAKYLMTLLQTAKEHADHPDQAVNSLKRERLASGVDNDRFDRLVEQSCAEGAGVYHIPECRAVYGQLIANIRQM